MRDLPPNQPPYPKAETCAFGDVVATDEPTFVNGRFVNALGVDMETGYNINDVPPIVYDDRPFEERLAELDAVVAETGPPVDSSIVGREIKDFPTHRQILRCLIDKEVAQERVNHSELVFAAESQGQDAPAMAATGTEGRIATLVQDKRPQLELHPPGYKQAVLMARYLLGSGDPNTDFHVFDENGQRNTKGYLAQFYLYGDGEDENSHAHQLFLDALEIADDPPEPGSPYDGEPEIVKMVLDGKGVITRQVISIPDAGPYKMLATYLAQRSMPAAEGTLAEMGFMGSEPLLTVGNETSRPEAN